MWCGLLLPLPTPRDLQDQLCGPTTAQRAKMPSSSSTPLPVQRSAEGVVGGRLQSHPQTSPVSLGRGLHGSTRKIPAFVFGELTVDCLSKVPLCSLGRPGTSAKLRLVVQHGLGTLRVGEKHGLQPALVISWAQHLSHMVSMFGTQVCVKSV